MGLIGEIRARARYIVGPVLGISAVIYFAYHVVQGDRGLTAWLNLNQQVAAKRAEAKTVAARRKALQNKVRMLHPETIDPDLLDERARRMLNYGRPGDIVIPYDR